MTSRVAVQLEPEWLEGVRIVDVHFDGRRVWSVASEAIPAGRLSWPAALKPYLDGRTTMTLHDAATGTVIGTEELRFGRSQDRIALRDAAGRPLAMNKWNRLGPVFDGGNVELRSRLLENAQRIVEVLEAEAFAVYIVGGSLLGYMRTGGLMAHDDDIDLAFLSEHSDPSDIGLDSFRMQRALEAAGYTVVRHSLAHLEVDFFDAQGHVEHYVDIFTGYFRDGLYCQPFALRGPEVVREDLVPVRRVEVDGVELPAPARPEAWLEYAYGPSWLVPDPSFVFETSRWTRRRFENSFGVFNRARVYWEKHFLSLGGAAEPDHDDRDAVLRWAAALPTGARVLDVGCGTGAATNLIASSGHEVLGIDFSHEALSIAVERAVPGARFAYVNVNDRRDLLALGARMLATGDVWYVRIADVLHGLTMANRHTLFRLLELVLRGGGVATGTVPTTLPSGYRRGDPTSWHYPEEWFQNELSNHRLQVEFMETSRRHTAHGTRDEVAFVIRPINAHQSAQPMREDDSA
ncbi:methyltransferase domain-containing protein [Agromyces sp. Marseille-Q5079]|uniref:methyltransferase domain-containing protein n=1 Tax=Agromyces sp. Marseille-Q5079 TaxID=3439059 RepID=UPI003D9CA5B5